MRKFWGDRHGQGTLTVPVAIAEAEEALGSVQSSRGWRASGTRRWL